MGSVELKIIQFLENKKAIVFYMIITILALGARYSGINFVSDDMKYFLITWYDTISSQGNDALSSQVGDYGILYQTIIFFLVKFPLFAADTKYKLVSMMFDFLLAACASYIVCKITKKSIISSAGVITYTLVIMCPTVILNSAFWGQCDSIYTFFCLATIALFMTNHFKLAFCSFGMAFAFKLQAVFLLPFLLCYYVYTKRFSILNIFISIFVFWFSGIVAYIKGRDLLANFDIYIHQTQQYSSTMYLNIASFWTIFGKDPEFIKLYSIMFTIALLGFGLFNLLDKKDYFDSYKNILHFAAWSVWTCILFLPQMHERYTYPLDILLIILAYIDKRYIVFAFTSIMISTLTYNHYLFETSAITNASTIIYVSCWLLFTLLDRIVPASTDTDC